MEIDSRIRTLSLLTLVIVGLAVVSAIFLWPFCVVINHQGKSAAAATTAFIFNFIHIILLIFIDQYLYIHRWILLPIRKPLMPIVMMITKSEVIKEKEDTWYVRVPTGNKTLDLPATQTSSAKEDHGRILFKSLPKSVRREIKRKIQIYNSKKIQTETRHCNYMSLWRDIPILYDHEKRAVKGKNQKSFIGEFIQRFLVIFLCTDGFIDRYYLHISSSSSCSEEDVSSDKQSNDNLLIKNRLVALSWFVCSGSTLHNYMYFCHSSECQSGIWAYQHYRMILRGSVAASTSETLLLDDKKKKSNQREDGTRKSKSETSSLISTANSTTSSSSSKICFVNFFHHQSFSKKCIGAKSASYNDTKLLRKIYPFQFFREPPRHIINLKIKENDVLK